MPHVILKMVAGRSEAQKAALADLVTKAVMAGANTTDDAVSVAIEDIAPADWSRSVFDPDITGNWDRLYKKPGYGRPTDPWPA